MGAGMARWRSKDPNDILDYTLDWTRQMAKDTDTIAAYSITVEEGSVEVDEASGHGTDFDDTTTVVWLMGGVAGEECVVVNTIETAEGRVYNRRRKLKIKEL